jgi:prepilin-type N-terminal cleavage/methylation domain-containing protein
VAAVTRRSLGAASGFSVIELLVSCAIVAVLAALGMPAYMNALEAAKIARAVGDVRGIDRDIQIHRTLTGCLPGSLADIDQDFRRDPWGQPQQQRQRRRQPLRGVQWRLHSEGAGAQGPFACTDQFRLRSVQPRA